MCLCTRRAGEGTLQLTNTPCAEIAVHQRLIVALHPKAGGRGEVCVYDSRNWQVVRTVPAPCECREMLSMTSSHVLSISGDKLVLSCAQADLTYVSENPAAEAYFRLEPEAKSAKEHRWLLYTRLAMPHPGQVCQVDADLSMLVMEPTLQACRLHVITSDGSHSDVKMSDVGRFTTARWFNNRLYVTVGNTDPSGPTLYMLS